MDEKQEKDFVRGIVQSLNLGISQIEEDKLARIRKSRQLAMAAYREPVTILGLVTVSGQTLDVSNWIRKPLFWLPILRYFIISATEVMGTFLTSLMKTPFSGDSLSSSLFF